MRTTNLGLLAVFALLGIFTAPSRSQALLYATAFDGSVNTLTLDEDNLTNTSRLVGCGSNPSWLTFTPGRLFCSNEGTPGSLSSFAPNNEGVLSLEAEVESNGGDVYSALYGQENQFMALAHFGLGSISTYTLPLANDSPQLQNLSFPFQGPGPVADRQAVSSPHQVLPDPSGQFMVSPDLGADIVRVFSIQGDGNLQQLADLRVEAGSGPRHAAFFQGSDGGNVFMYLTHELSSSMSGYKVTVNNGQPTFEQILAPFPVIPATSNKNQQFISGIQVFGNTVTVSNRNDTTFGAETDSLTVFSIDQNTGALGTVGIFSSGGSFPRTFDINNEGDLIAVGNQKSNQVVIMDRNPDTGEIGDAIASITLGGEVSSVVWGCGRPWVR